MHVYTRIILSEKLDFQVFPIISIFYTLSLWSYNFSNLLSLFAFCYEIPSGNWLQLKKISLALLAWSKILYLFLVLFLALLAFNSEIPGVGTMIFLYTCRLGSSFGFTILNFSILGD